MMTLPPIGEPRNIRLLRSPNSKFKILANPARERKNKQGIKVEYRKTYFTVQEGKCSATRPGHGARNAVRKVPTLRRAKFRLRGCRPSKQR
jgi:hypothetical protein